MKTAVPPLNWRSSDGRYRVQISRKCFIQMQRMAISRMPNEIGTALVGTYSEDGHKAFVLSIAPLAPDSVGTRSRFIRGVKGLREFFATISRRFHGSRFRVGEWHSHPDVAPVVSPIDKETQASIATDKSEGLPEAILVVLGGDLAQKPELAVYVFSRTRGQVDLTPFGS